MKIGAFPRTRRASCGVGLSLQSFCLASSAKRISAQSLTQAPAQPPLARTMSSESDFIAKQRSLTQQSAK
ncbi:MAG: hypothetical protein LBQ31_10650 [Bacteroidales bacterium]|nr:hypothetical protein [Bacteroidales bacterium]